MTWRDWWLQHWGDQIDAYIRLGWKLIPIGFRSKLPVQSRSNYASHGSRGPYLTKDEALWWIREADSNLAVVAGPSRIWADMDRPELFHDFMLKGLVSMTPRGYALPLKRDQTFRSKTKAELERLGFEFRQGYAYELVAVSTTCLNDHGLRGKPHPKPTEPCSNGRHRYLVREWVTPLTSPLLTFKAFYEGVTR